MAQNYPKWPKYDARIYALCPQIFFTEKAVPQTFSLLECMGQCYFDVGNSFVKEVQTCCNCPARNTFACYITQYTGQYREIQRTDAIFMKFKPVAIVAPASEISSTLRVRVTISESLLARFGCCAASVIISVATFQ